MEQPVCLILWILLVKYVSLVLGLGLGLGLYQQSFGLQSAREPEISTHPPIIILSSIISHLSSSPPKLLFCLLYHLDYLSYCFTSKLSVTLAFG
jgi:hypothetical protein